MLERMKAREGAKAQSYQTGGGGGDVRDPMESVSQRIDFEGKLRQRIADAEGHARRSVRSALRLGRARAAWLG